LSPALQARDPRPHADQEEIRAKEQSEQQGVQELPGLVALDGAAEHAAETRQSQCREASEHAVPALSCCSAARSAGGQSGTGARAELSSSRRDVAGTGKDPEPRERQSRKVEAGREAVRRARGSRQPERGQSSERGQNTGGRRTAADEPR
jgi:hypothetical protein